MLLFVYRVLSRGSSEWATFRNSNFAHSFPCSFYAFYAFEWGKRCWMGLPHPIFLLLDGVECQDKLVKKCPSQRPTNFEQLDLCLNSTSFSSFECIECIEWAGERMSKIWISKSCSFPGSSSSGQLSPLRSLGTQPTTKSGRPEWCTVIQIVTQYEVS